MHYYIIAVLLYFLKDYMSLNKALKEGQFSRDYRIFFVGKHFLLELLILTGLGYITHYFFGA